MHLCRNSQRALPLPLSRLRCCHGLFANQPQMRSSMHRCSVLPLPMRLIVDAGEYKVTRTVWSPAGCPAVRLQDPKKFNRVRQLLVANEEIKEAKKVRIEHMRTQ